MDTISRRKFVAGIGTATVAAVSGCMKGEEENNDSPDNSSQVQEASNSNNDKTNGELYEEYKDYPDNWHVVIEDDDEIPPVPVTGLTAGDWEAYNAKLQYWEVRNK